MSTSSFKTYDICRQHPVNNLSLYVLTQNGL